MKTTFKTYKPAFLSPNIVARFGQLICACALLDLASIANGQTLISGNVSGTWSPANNPYVIIDNATVPSGQTLVVKPGTEVIIGSNLDLTVNGLIMAKGTPTDHITFRGANDSTPYDHIELNCSSDNTYEFSYCDFETAFNALYTYVAGYNPTITVLIDNCTFSNCSDHAIYANAYGGASGYTRYNPHMDLFVRNSVFTSTSRDACEVYLNHGCDIYCGASHAESLFAGNIFRDIGGAAIHLTSDQIYNAATATIVNNTFISCQGSVVDDEPQVTLIEDNIFEDDDYAVVRNGSVNSTVGYNCFYQNGTNFLGYPSSYGQIVLNNRNGTPCDVAYNILQDPLFVSTNDFHLATNSPCIDAGTSDWDWTDMCFPPSQGTAYPDLGVYGGPDACNWLTNVPTLATSPWMSQSNGVVSINWGALPRSTYEIQYITNILDTNWITLRDVTAVEKPNSQTLTATGKQDYYRIQSLGRTPGN